MTRQMILPDNYLTKKIIFHKKALHSVQYQVLYISAYKTAPGLVHHKSLMGMLPSINSDFQKGKQQCAAEFFQEFCRELGYKSTEEH